MHAGRGEIQAGRLEIGPFCPPTLDETAGHIDPGGWYHWHGTSTDIASVYNKASLDATCGLAQSASAQFGYAYDGFAMFGTADADGTIPSDVDACGGHTGPTSALPEDEYHYHATTDFPNLPNCLTGVQAEDNFRTTAKTGIGADRSSWWWPFDEAGLQVFRSEQAHLAGMVSLA